MVELIIHRGRGKRVKCQASATPDHRQEQANLVGAAPGGAAMHILNPLKYLMSISRVGVYYIQIRTTLLESVRSFYKCNQKIGTMQSIQTEAACVV